MSLYLFTVNGYDSTQLGIGLLPGIPQSLLKNTEVGHLGQGSNLLLVFPGGAEKPVTLENYHINVPVGFDLNPATLPIIPVLSPDIDAAKVPIGTRVYAIGGAEGGHR